MKILIYGQGWIGTQISLFLNRKCLFGKARIENYKDVAAELDGIKPDVVINAAGRTGDPNIDWCLDHRAETAESNTFGPGVLARACAERDIYLVLLSTGCLWNEYPPDKPKGFCEIDEPKPNSFYSITKVGGEAWVFWLHARSLILRIRMPFGNRPHKRSLITKLLSIPDGGVLINEPNSLTCISDFIMVLGDLIDARATGIYHVVNPGPVRNHDIIQMCYDEGIIDRLPELELVGKDEFHARNVTRDGRSNCILDTTKLESTLGFRLRHSNEALASCINCLEMLKSL